MVLITAKKKPELSEEAKKPIAEVRADYQRLLNENEKLKKGMKCAICGKIKPMTNVFFYVNTDPFVATGFSPYCKDCIKKLARRIDNDDVEHGATKSSVMKALQYLDKPFLDKIWDASYYETENSDKSRKAKIDIWGNYIKNIQMPQYEGLRWEDGDVYKESARPGIMDAALSSELEEQEFERRRQVLADAIKESEHNKEFIIESLGYDPFDNYPNPEDKPRLYNNMASFMDDDAKNDPMKMMAIIEIVKSYNQIEKINQSLDSYVSNPTTIVKDVGYIDKLSATKKKLNDTAVALAKDNGLSVNHNNNKSKGANTLSGKIKKLSEIGFRDAQINTFDYETCEGMRQVAELSEEARHRQIGYSENIAQEIKDIKVELVETLTKERDAALETMRVLLVENNDLKAALQRYGDPDAV